MLPRITFTMNKDGELLIWINEVGRDMLVDLLKSMDSRNDHFHLAPRDEDADAPLSTIPYSDDQVVVQYAKVMLRLDTWDAKYFPHVLQNN